MFSAKNIFIKSEKEFVSTERGNKIILLKNRGIEGMFDRNVKKRFHFKAKMAKVDPFNLSGTFFSGNRRTLVIFIFGGEGKNFICTGDQEYVNQGVLLCISLYLRVSLF